MTYVLRLWGYSSVKPPTSSIWQELVGWPKTDGRWKVGLKTDGRWEVGLKTDGRWEVGLKTDGRWEVGLKNRWKVGL